MSDFDLRAAFKTAKRAGCIGPEAFAQAMFDLTPPELIARAYLITLRFAARVFIGEDRRERMRPVEPAPRTVGRRHKLQARIAHNERLQAEVDGLDGRRLLGKCNYADLLAAAKYRRDLASSNLYWARVFDRLADKLTEYGVELVEDLPPEAIDAAFESPMGATA